jgi:hypothetical protein
MSESVTINGINLDLERIIDFNTKTITNFQLPEWVNQAPEIKENFYTKEITEFYYVVRVNDFDRWNLEKVYANHSTIQLIDTIYGVNLNVWITNIKAEYSFKKNITWIVSLNLIGAL